MIWKQGVNGKNTVVDSVSVNDVNPNSIFGRYSDNDMVAQLKRLAIDPCRLQFGRDKIKPLYDQILGVRKVMLKDSEIPWRKRKLEQYVKDKLRHPVGFHQQKKSKLSRKQLSHASSVLSLVNSINSPDGKALLQSHNSSSLLTCEESLLEKPCSSKTNGKYEVLDSDESVVDSSLPSHKNHIHIEAPCVESTITKNHLKSLNIHGSKKKDIHPLHWEIADQPQECVIPIGPQFQADIPKWNGSIRKSIIVNEYVKESYKSKWLGTLVWPIESIKIVGGEIGNGRSDSCSCISPRSIDCIKCHSFEANLILRCDLGPVFFSWKFHEIGWHVAKSWTLKDQRIFDSQVAMDGDNFLKIGLKYLPNKSSKEIIDYYFNVYMPYYLSMETRSSSTMLVASDDEEGVKNILYMGVERKLQEKALEHENAGSFLRHM